MCGREDLFGVNLKDGSRCKVFMVTESVMLACYVILRIRRAGIATLRQPSCKRHTFPKSSLHLDPQTGLFCQVLELSSHTSPASKRLRWTRRASHARVDERHEAQMGLQALPSAVEPTTRFSATHYATATRVDQPRMLCIIANRIDVNPLWQVF